MERRVGRESWKQALAQLRRDVERHAAESRTQNLTWGEFLLFFIPRGSDPPSASAGGSDTVVVSPVARLLSDWDKLRLRIRVVGPDGTSGPLGTGGHGTQASTCGKSTRSLESLDVLTLRQELRRVLQERHALLERLAEDERLVERRAEQAWSYFRHEGDRLTTRVETLEQQLENAREEITHLTHTRDKATTDAAAWERRALKAECTVAELETVAATARGEAACEAEATKSAKTATTRLSDAQTRLEAEAAVLRRDHSRTLVEKRALERQLRRLQEQTDKERANLQKVRWYWAEW